MAIEHSDQRSAINVRSHQWCVTWDLSVAQVTMWVGEWVLLEG